MSPHDSLSAQDFYNNRFSVGVDTADMDSAVLAIDIAHTDVMRLLDLIIEIGESTHFNYEHLYATARGAMARLAETTDTLEAVSAFVAKAGFAQRNSVAHAKPAQGAPEAFSDADRGMVA